VNLAVDGVIRMKFGRPTQNDMSMMMERSESKPEIEFQHGGHLFSLM